MNAELKLIETCYHGKRLDEDCVHCAQDTGMELPMDAKDRLLYEDVVDLGDPPPND